MYCGQTSKFILLTFWLQVSIFAGVLYVLKFVKLYAVECLSNYTNFVPGTMAEMKAAEQQEVEGCIINQEPIICEKGANTETGRKHQVRKGKPLKDTKGRKGRQNRKDKNLDSIKVLIEGDTCSMRVSYKGRACQGFYCSWLVVIPEDLDITLLQLRKSFLSFVYLC